MPILPYSVTTIAGSALWCAVLAWFGQHVLGSDPKLVEDPQAMLGVLKAKSMTIGVGVAVLAAMYFVVVRLTSRKGDGAAGG
jgi:membrane protein DedA with SNARE-associated domain